MGLGPAVLSSQARETLVARRFAALRRAWRRSGLRVEDVAALAGCSVSHAMAVLVAERPGRLAPETLGAIVRAVGVDPVDVAL